LEPLLAHERKIFRNASEKKKFCKVRRTIQKSREIGNVIQVANLNRSVLLIPSPQLTLARIIYALIPAKDS
jgi:hypothetical protein